MNGRSRHRGPDSAGLFLRGPVALAARRLSIIDLEGGDQPIANEDGRVLVVQNGEIYNFRELRAGAGAARGTASRPVRHRGARPPLRGAWRGLRRAAAGHVRHRPLGRAASGGCCSARDRFGIKPLYYRLAGEDALLRLRAEGAAAQPGFSRAIDPGRSRPSSPSTRSRRRSRSSPRPASCPPGHLLVWRGGEVAVRRYARPRPVAAGEVREGGIDELAAELRDACATRSAPIWSPTCRSACCSPAGSTRGARRAGRGRVGRGAAHVLDRLRGALLRRAGAGAPGRRALRDRPPRAGPAPRRRRAAAEARRGLRRAVRRLVGAAHLPRLAAGRRRGQGRALRRGRRRAVRRLLHLRRRHARPARRPPRGARRAAGRGAAQLRQPRSASTTRRSASRGPRTCRRWSATTPGRRSSRAQRRAALLAAATRAGTRSTSTARATPRPRAPSELARLQDVDIGIYLVDDLLVKTDRASMAHSLELRVPFCDQRGRRRSRSPCRTASRSGASPRSACCGGRWRRCCRGRSCAGRKQGFSIPLAAWLRGPLRAVRARCALAGDPAPPGLPRPGGGHAAARRALLGPRGSEPPALGPDGLHALVRPVCSLAWTDAASLDALLAFLARGRS